MDELLKNLHSSIVAKQKQEILTKKFMTFENDQQRILFMYNVLEEFNIIPNEKCEIKNSTDSCKFRNEGNQIFTSKIIDANDYIKAWELYSKSIAFAENNSEELALAFANRSAVLVRLEKYSDALKDIEMALKLNYPEHLRGKLLIRKTECLAFLNDPQLMSVYDECLFWLDKMNLDNSRREIFENKLINAKKISMKNGSNQINSYPCVPMIVGQEEIPCATSALAVKFNDTFGRHVVTTRDIEPGEILAVEKPYSMILTTENMYTHCGHCLGIAWSSVPCEHCVFVVYCSENCKELAWQLYHDIECQVTGFLLNLDMNKLGLFSMRLAIIAVREFGNFEKLRDELVHVDSCQDERTKGFSDNGILESDKYRSIYSLVTNTEKRSSSDLFGRVLNASIILYFIAKRTLFFNQTFDGNNLTSISSNNDAMFIGGLILRHQQIIPSNMHTVSEERNLDSEDRGSAALPFYSLINHSCDPNVARSSLAEHVVLYALYPMEKDTQIFDNYGFHYAIMPKAERRLRLSRQFHFQCECIPCRESWPTYFKLPSFHILIQSNSDKMKIENALIKFNEYVKFATDGKIDDKPYILNDLIKMIKVLMTYVTLPCVEVNNVVETLKRVFDLNGNRFEVPSLKVA
ncbi:SET and MYND domain-containing protein 4-like [Leptopilina heterotoma]|uniref:SET and MYND domain-containing protein 4-like n=1 Tax=Leptopilina heterotoma TaxID=63436 RepID=UPI001CA9D367|nr:SET and MYND domain-containing protein 4-like [Leptopilina heterotoma]